MKKRSTPYPGCYEDWIFSQDFKSPSLDAETPEYKWRTQDGKIGAVPELRTADTLLAAVLDEPSMEPTATLGPCVELAHSGVGMPSPKPSKRSFVKPILTVGPTLPSMPVLTPSVSKAEVIKMPDLEEELDYELSTDSSGSDSESTSGSSSPTYRWIFLCLYLAVSYSV